jgi:uncharacterized membrane protein (UPF0136 family)
MRRIISILLLVLIGLGFGWFLKNVKLGLIIGIVLGLLMSGIATKSK